MKLKILVKIVDSVLGSSKDDETPADMYLPSWLRAFGLVLLAAGTAAFIISFIVHKLTFLLLGVGLFIGGVLACLCWKNQKARVLSDQEFEYTTFLGKSHRYYFRDITGLRKNSDSMTLYVSGSKVHIESCAILSERFVNLINQALKTL